MVKCCILCKKYGERDGKRSLHRFPMNPFLREKWCSIIAKENVSQYARLCSDHFLPGDFIVKPSGIKYLKKEALPIEECTFIKELDSENDDDECSDRDMTHMLAGIQSSMSELPSTSTGVLDASKVITDSSTETASEAEVQYSMYNDDDECSEQDMTHMLAGIQSSMSELPSTSTEVLDASKVIPGSSTETASEAEVQYSSISLCGNNTSSTETAKSDTEFAVPALHPRYFGDCKTDDMESPRKARRNWQIAKKTVHMQRKKIKNLQQARRRLKLKVTSLKSLINHLREKYDISECAESVLQASLPGPSGEILKRMLKGTSRQKYTPEIRSFALTLSFYSTKGYNYVRETFNKSLPHTSTISKWYQSIDGTPGFTKEALHAIKIKVSELSNRGHKVLCNLLMDEMAIMRRTEWTGSTFVGGTEQSLNIGTNLGGVHLPEATEALVFMLVCINGHWKIPVGYLLVNGLSGQEKANVVIKLLEFLYETGAIITSFTFDGAPSNFKMAVTLGANLNNLSSLVTYFPHPVTKENIFIFLDICHMLKLVRNCIGDKLNFVDDEGNIISWTYYKQLAEIQNNEGLRAGTKLSKRHIQWFREKMKVKLAAQLFSNSVSDAFLFLRDDIKMSEFKDVGATAKFTKIFNDIFDIFNSRSKFSKVSYRRAINIESSESIFQFLRYCENYISQLKMNGELVWKSNRKVGFLGFIVGIRSLEGFYKRYILETPLLKYILTYKFSQDHLEIFFSIVRSKGGSNNNPTPRQFQSIYKRLLIHTELKGSEHANAVAMDNTSILYCSSANISRTVTGEDLSQSGEYLQMSKDILELDFLGSSAWHLTTYCSDIVAYIAGFVVKNIKKCITCEYCLRILEVEAPLSKLQFRKCYGKLINASLFVIDICRTAEKSLRVILKEVNIYDPKYKNISLLLQNKTIRNLPSRILDSFGDHLLETDPLQHHPMTLIKLILDKYINIRLHHEAKKLKDLSQYTRVRSMLTKTILFKNQ